MNRLKKRLLPPTVLASFRFSLEKCYLYTVPQSVRDSPFQKAVDKLNGLFFTLNNRSICLDSRRSLSAFGVTGIADENTGSRFSTG